MNYPLRLTERANPNTLTTIVVHKQKGPTMNKLTASIILLTTIATASPLPDFPFILASGEAETKIAPDMAVITFQAKAFHQDSATAVDAMRKVSIEAIKLLKSQSIPDDAITAFELNKRAVRKRKDHTQQEVVGYQINRDFKLTIKDLSRYEAIANALFKMDNIGNINTTFDRQDYSKVEAELLTEACSAAKRHAMDLAGGFGGELGSVHCISQSGFSHISGTFLFNSGGWGYGDLDGLGMPVGDMYEESANKQPLFIPATITFRNSVDVLYRLK